jgi:hypothetical protein
LDVNGPGTGGEAVDLGPAGDGGPAFAGPAAELEGSEGSAVGGGEVDGGGAAAVFEGRDPEAEAAGGG